MYHTEYQTACDLYAIYQREYVFKTLKSNIVSGRITKYDNRIIARNKVLEHKLMSAIATPPDLFDSGPAQRRETIWVKMLALRLTRNTE